MKKRSVQEEAHLELCEMNEQQKDKLNHCQRQVKTNKWASLFP